jgi:hypothetical protein
MYRVKVKKGAKNSYGGYPTEIVSEVQKSIGSIGLGLRFMLIIEEFI